MTIILNGTTGITTPDIDSTGGLDAADLTGALPALDGSALNNLTSANLSGALPALDGSALTGIPQPKSNLFTFVQSTSGTFTVPFDCTMVIQLIGAGGSGARLANQYGTNRTVLATGGSSGALAMKTVTATAGQTFTVTVGAGVENPSISDTNAGTNGIAGGNSSITGPNVSMTANGGGGGVYYSNSGYDPTKTLTSASGGAASGGDTNLTGNTSTAKVGFDAGNYTFASGCSSGAAAGRLGAVTETNTKRGLHRPGASVSYATANSVSQPQASDRAQGPFYHYQADRSRGSSALFHVTTVSNYNSKQRYQASGNTDWNGQSGGGSGSILNTAYGSTITMTITGETGVTSGNGLCLFTMFADL